MDGLASDLKISIAAFLDANGNGELDEFADPNGVYNEGVAVEVGTSGRFNLNLDLGKDNLSITSVTAESAVGGYYHTITWNSLPVNSIVSSTPMLRQPVHLMLTLQRQMDDPL